MSAILLPRKFTRQPQQPTLIADGRRPGACFIGSSQAELVGGRSLSESNLIYDVKPIGRVRTVTLGRGFSDSYPVMFLRSKTLRFTCMRHLLMLPTHFNTCLACLQALALTSGNVYRADITGASA